MPKHPGAKRRLSLKISSKYVGKWIVRPIAQMVARESLKLERLIEAIRIESHSHRIALRDEVLKEIGELEESIDAIARLLARGGERE